MISVAYDTCNRLHFLVLLYCSLCISDNKMETKRRFVCCFIDELGRLKYSNSAGFWALLQHAQLSWPSWSVTKNFIYCLRIVIFSSQIVIKPKPLRYELKRGCYLLTLKVPRYLCSVWYFFHYVKWSKNIIMYLDKVCVKKELLLIFTNYFIIFKEVHF